MCVCLCAHISTSFVLPCALIYSNIFIRGLCRIVIMFNEIILINLEEVIAIVESSRRVDIIHIQSLYTQ